MNKKSFVSISISNYKIKVVKLSSDGKHAVKAASYPIPSGIIEQGKVQKAPELAGLIKTIWKKENIHEKTVGVIVPEFSTFMKTLVLPKLSFNELDEAIRWKSKEFLPHEGTDMVLDWKIIGELKDSYEILLVAIEVEDLSGFVGAVDAAGLLPVLVETTSLCLERLAEKKEEQKLVLYKSRGTVVAVVVSGKKILTTSVLNDEDDISLIKSLLHIVMRYGKSSLKTIAVCGNGLTQDFVNDLHVKAGIPIELFNLPVEGLTPGQVQEYIIGLSQQQINPEEPASAYSINLLPSSWVIHYKTQARDISLWTNTLVGSVVIWLCFLATMGSYAYLSQKVVETAKSQDASSSAQLKTVTDEISKINTLAAKIETVSKSFIYPQEIINSINKMTPKGILITGHEVNIETGKVGIVGEASDREALLLFKEALENGPEFSKTTIPLNNLLSVEKILFSISLEYKQVKK